MNVADLRRQVDGLLEGRVPIRTTDIRGGGQPIGHPVYVECNAKLSESFKKLRLEENQAAIYAIGLEPLLFDFSNAVVVGRSEQKKPSGRITGGYTDRIRTCKRDTTLTITSLQLLALKSGKKSFTIYCDVLEVCHKDTKDEREKFYIRALRERGAPLLNAK